MWKFKQKLQFLRTLDILDEVLDYDDESDSNMLDTTVSYLNNKFRIPKEDEPPPYEPPAKKKSIDLSNPLRGLKDAENPMEMYSDIEFKKRYRLSKETTIDILQMIMYGLKKVTNRGQPIPPLMELLITLKFIITGSFQTKTEDKVSQPSVCRIIRKITTLLADLKLRFVKLPDRNDFRRVSERFKAIGGFPEVVGCLGSTQIGVKSPGKAMADEYLNEKGYYSFRVQVIVGPNLEFLDVVSRWPGATHENKIFCISEARHRFEFHQIDGVLLASNNYASNSYIMTPIPNPRNVCEWKYNEAHRNTYNVQEAVDLWKRRFKCLQSVLNTKEETTQNIIASCAVLHNIARQRNEIFSDEEESVPIPEIKGKENFKRKYPIDMGIMNEPLGLVDRDVFIQKHFKE